MSSDVAALISDNLDVWTSAIERKSGAGRGGGKKVSLNGIERLRALILNLAVSGKLVPQNPGDEPASHLLNRVGKLRQMTGHRRQQQAASPRESALASPLPNGWEIVRLEQLANPQAGFAFKSKYFNEQAIGLPLIRIRDVGQPFTGTYFSGDFRDEFLVAEGDYLISMDGEFRVATWTGSKALLNQRVARLQFYDENVSRPFVVIALQMALTKLQGVKAYTTVDHLSGKQIADALIPVPPLAEQARIVAKVDELMALCDALESQSTSALEAHQMLVETLLATLVNAIDATDLARQWARLEIHFDTLFTTDASIETLKQTVLELGVLGKLVSRDNPDGWFSAKLGEVIGPMDSGWSPACLAFPARHEDIWGVLKTTAVQRLDYQADQNKELPDNLRPRPDAECQVGDILITRAGPTNRVGICCYVYETRPRLMISDKIVRFRPASDAIDGAYLALALSVGPAAAQIEKAKSGMAASQVNISRAKLREVDVLLPPLREQQRIITKVDELITLCDSLKTRLMEGAHTQKHLADAIVERAAA